MTDTRSDERVTQAEMGDPSNAERWLPVVGYEGCYEVSDHGRIRSVARVVERHYARGKPMRPLPVSTKIRRQFPSPKGYPSVSLSKRGVIKTKQVHALVLTAFVGVCPPGYEACHWDGDRTNPRLTNLRWGTGVDNAADMRRHGTMLLGNQRKIAKLTPDIVRSIRARIGTAPQSEIAADYGVNQSTISLVGSGRTWSHVR
jgi:hypothetical protein